MPWRSCNGSSRLDGRENSKGVVALMLGTGISADYCTLDVLIYHDTSNIYIYIHYNYLIYTMIQSIIRMWLKNQEHGSGVCMCLFLSVY